MKKIRGFLAVIALVATLSGSSLLGAGAVANAAASRHASASFVVGQSTKSAAFVPDGPCPSGGAIDC